MQTFAVSRIAIHPCIHAHTHTYTFQTHAFLPALRSAFDSDTILDLVDMPPAAPPPPIAPLNELTQVPIKRVMAAGGLDDSLDITTALTHCTDNGAETPCSALD